MNVLENIFVIHFTGARFFSSGVVTDLEIGNMIPRSINVIDDVSFIALHVIHVEQNFARRTVHCLADHKRLIGMTKKQIRRITQWFEYHNQSVRFENRCASLQRIYYIHRLIF